MSNETPFRFLDLPDELRLMVYEHVLGDDDEPLMRQHYTYHHELITRSRRQVAVTHYELERGHKNAKPMVHPLVFVSKGVNEEVQPLCISTTEYLFSDAVPCRLTDASTSLQSRLRHLGIGSSAFGAEWKAAIQGAYSASSQFRVGHFVDTYV